MRTRAQRYQDMLHARRVKEARVLIQAAPLLLAQLAEIGGAAHAQECEDAGNSLQALMLRSADVVEVASLIKIELGNLCALINQRRGARPAVEVVGLPDPSDQHYGAARTAASFVIKEIG